MQKKKESSKNSNEWKMRFTVTTRLDIWPLSPLAMFNANAVSIVNEGFLIFLFQMAKN